MKMSEDTANHNAFDTATDGDNGNGSSRSSNNNLLNNDNAATDATEL